MTRKSLTLKTIFKNERFEKAWKILREIERRNRKALFEED